MSKRTPFVTVVTLFGALVALGACGTFNMARAVDSLVLPKDLPSLDKRGGWRETLEDLALLGVPQRWLLLGPISNETAKSFDKQLEPELTDDWTRPMTDNLGRLFRAGAWTKPNDEDGCYVDLNDIFPNPPVSPVAWAMTSIDSTIDGPALLWFENAGRAVVYFNNKQILSVAGKISKTEGAVQALFPIPVDLKRGRNVLKVKILNERKQALKGWGFFARIERDDIEWRKLLLTKLKELYPDEDAAQPGAQERLMLARRHERSGHPELAEPLYKEVLANYGSCEDACSDARDAMKRLKAGAQADDPADALRAWRDTEQNFKASLASAQTLAADRVLGEFIAKYPFSENAGLALCYRGGLRLDYACVESARPFYDRALREYSRNETVRMTGVKGLEFARFYTPQHARFDTDREVENALTALQRQLRDGNGNDKAAGVKALAELLITKPGTLVHAGGSDLYPRFASVNQVARELLKGLNPEELALFREPLARASETLYRHALPGNDPIELEEVARRFPGTSASANALNRAGNLYLDRGLNARAAQAFRTLLRDYKGSGLIAEPLVAAKEIRALEGLGQTQAAHDAAQRMSAEYGAAKMVFGGREMTVAEYLLVAAQRLEGTPATEVPAIIRGDYETFAANTRRLGAPPESFAPAPDKVAWVRGVEPSEFGIRARSFWPEDRSYLHIEPFPVAASGKLFFATRQEVRAVDVASGKELWSKRWDRAGSIISDRSTGSVLDRFAGFPHTIPAYKDAKLFVRVVSSEHYSVLRCYDAATGNVDWDTEKSPALSKFVWSSEPLAAYNLVVAVYFEALDHETVRYGVAALDARTGKLVWNRVFGVGNAGVRIAERFREARFAHVNYRVTMQFGPPSAFEGTIYTSTGLGSLAALNAYSGEILWMAEYPRLCAGNLFTGNSGIEGFQPRLLKVLARGPSSPVVGDNLVVLAPRDAAGIVAFDRRTGELRWSRDMLDARFIAGVCDGKLLAADDTVTAIDFESGKTVWEYPAGKRLAGQPGFAGNVLYLPYEDGLHRVDARDGLLKDKQPWDPKSSGPMANIVVTATRIIGINNSVLAGLGVK